MRGVVAVLVCAVAFAAVERRPKPVLEGLVIDRATHAPIAGARVATDTGVITRAGRDGRFRLEVDPARWPKQPRAAVRSTRQSPVGRQKKAAVAVSIQLATATGRSRA